MLRRTAPSTAQENTGSPHQNSDYAREPRSSGLHAVAAKSGLWFARTYRIVGLARETASQSSDPLLDEEDKQKKQGQIDKSSLWSDWWLWEVLSGVFSMICLIAIFIVLFIYEKKSVPQMPYNITVRILHVYHVVSDWLCSSTQWYLSWPHSPSPLCS